MSEITEDVRRKILQAAEDIRKTYCNPTEMCIVSSRNLSESLRKLDINYEIITGNFLCGKSPRGNPKKNHTWGAFPQYNNAIIDITADQFGDFPSIWFPAGKKCYKSWWERKHERTEMRKKRRENK